MKTWKRFAVINVGVLTGIGLSLFLVPPNTPFWLWAIIATAIIGGFNFLLYKTQRRSPTKPKLEPLPAFIGWICTGFFLLELVFHFFHR
jgi:hypothetical protein